MSKENSCLKEIIVGTLATVFGGIVLALIPITRNFVGGLFNLAGKLLQTLWDFLISEITLPWAVIAILLLLAFPTILNFVRRLMPKSGELQLSNYKEDNLFSIVWRWSVLYDDDYIAPFCPSCNTRLIYKRDDTYTSHKRIFYCETCSRDIVTIEGDYDSIVKKVWRQIERKVNNGEWKQVVANKKTGTRDK